MDAISAKEAKSIILGIVYDFLENTPDQFPDYAEHVGFDLTALRVPEDFNSAWLAFYRTRKGQYDLTRAANDLATWPPVAQEIERQLKAKLSK